MRGDALRLLAGLTNGAARGFIELRLIEPHTRAVRQEFFPLAELEGAVEAAIAARENADAYFGVAPRVREAGGRDAVNAVPAVWVDVDTPAAREVLDAFAAPPSLVVASGTEGNVHAYWLLETPTDVATAERLNRLLAQAIGADPAAVDASRILRLPGTLNHKTSPPTEVRLMSDTDRRYSVHELTEAVPAAGASAETANAHTETSRAVAGVLAKLEAVTATSAGWMARCPAHDDRQPSLSIGQGEDGRCLAHCFAGCTLEQVLDAVELRVSDLFPPEQRSGRRASSRLVALAEKEGVEPFTSLEGAAHATVVVGDHSETWPITSPGFAEWLRGLHFTAYREALPTEVISEVVATFSARARFEGPKLPVHRRVAPFEDGVVIDMSDEAWRAIVVTAQGWKVTEDPPVGFTRDGSTRALPEPVPGGSIEDLRPFVHCASEQSWLRFVGALVMAFNPFGPFPVTYPTGEQGSSKSTTSRVMASLVDPKDAPLVMGTPSVRDLASIAGSVWLVAFDNVSRVSGELSDALCQLSTGGGYRTRKLYTDAEPFILDLKRPVVLNAIGQVITRPDLLDRVAVVELAPIDAEDRLPEAVFWRRWEEARPRVLGALLDGVVAALTYAEDVEVEGFPRMADFARWVEAAAPAFGWETGMFTAALEAGRGELLEGSTDAFPEIAALLEFMAAKESWEGTATELLSKLTNCADDAVTGSRWWPKRADVLSTRLVQHAPLLREHRIEMSRRREAGDSRRRLIRLTRGGHRDGGTPVPPLGATE